MDFKFRNKPIKLQTLGASKISTIVNNLVKQQNDTIKQYLNEKQLNDFMTEISQSIKVDANEYIYKHTIELLMEQYEITIKPMIRNQLQEELREELKPSIIEQMKIEFKPLITDELKSELKSSITQQLKKELNP